MLYALVAILGKILIKIFLAIIFQKKEFMTKFLLKIRFFAKWRKFTTKKIH
jgi:hypothetical protein